MPSYGCLGGLLRREINLSQSFDLGNTVTHLLCEDREMSSRSVP